MRTKGAGPQGAATKVERRGTETLKQARGSKHQQAAVEIVGPGGSRRFRPGGEWETRVAEPPDWVKLPVADNPTISVSAVNDPPDTPEFGSLTVSVPEPK